MADVTIGEVAGGLALVAGIITSVALILKYLNRYLNSVINESVSSNIDTLRIQISRIEDKIDENDIERCKADLMNYIDLYNRHHELSDVQFEHMFTTYHHYRYDLHANSYIKNEMERIIKKENERWQSIQDR